jgi:hypothetical protein
VVHADAVAQPAADLLAVGAVEPHAVEGGLQRGLFLLRAYVEAHQALRGLAGGALREIHEVDGGAFVLKQRGDALGEGRLGVLEFQRHGPAVAAHGDARGAGDAGHFLFEKLRGAQRGRHEQEPRARHREERHLPRVAALGIGVVVKLIHDHHAHIALGAAVQGDVGEDLGGAAEDARLRIHARIARHHAHVLGAEIAAEREELLVDEGLDRAGVDRALAGAEGLEMVGGGDEGFAGTGGGVEDDVVPGEEFEDGLLLLRVELQPALGGDGEKAVEHGVRVRRAGQGRERGGGTWSGRHPPHKEGRGGARQGEARRGEDSRQPWHETGVGVGFAP